VAARLDNLEMIRDLVEKAEEDDDDGDDHDAIVF
jgi:hypothetical protein